jgi:hypothetical protein
MAMGRETIEQCRNTINYFNNGWSNQAYKNYLQELLNDVEYQKFITQTDIGKVLNEKLIQTIELYGVLWNTLGELGDKTRAFLNNQESLNNHNYYGGMD